MRLIAYLLSGALIAAGLALPSPRTLVAGAVVYALAELAHLAACYSAARKYRRMEWEPDGGKGYGQTALEWVRGAILIGGLIASLGIQDEATPSAVAGAIVYGTTIVCWLAAGVICEFVAGIPLRMGPGGWRPDRRRRR